MRIALYEPDIPQNTGTILRTCACLGIEAHIIEPAGFPVTDRAFRRAGMDYLDQVAIIRHGSFAAFEDWRTRERLTLVLLTTAAERCYLDHSFGDDQVLLFGRESAGVPDAVYTPPTPGCIPWRRHALVNVAGGCHGFARAADGRWPGDRIGYDAMCRSNAGCLGLALQRNAVRALLPHPPTCAPRAVRPLK
jgi:tRNA (cytidine/uridine-2'-O-)-methyltransferase